MKKKDMTTLSPKQVNLEKERIDYGEFLLHNHNERFKMNPITYQEGLEIVRVIKDELKLRELKLAKKRKSNLNIQNNYLNASIRDRI